MDYLTNNFTEILDAVSKSALDQNISAYAFGDVVRFGITGNKKFTQDNIVEFILSGYKIDIDRFNDQLSTYISINKKVIFNINKFCVVSHPFIIEFEVIKDFDVYSVDQVSKISSFTIDTIFYNVRQKVIIDVTNEGLQSLNNDPIIIKNIMPVKDWNIKTIFSFAKHISSFGVTQTFSDNINDMQNILLCDFAEPLDTTFADELIEIFITPAPGKALKFIKDTFPDGQLWLTEQLIELVSVFNVPINENIDIDHFLNDQVFELIDIYNEFFLFNKTISEIHEDKKNRIVTSFRLLFDSPSFNIDIPYIDRVSVLSAPNNEITSMNAGIDTVKLFDVPPGCEYGDCDPCNPALCTGQKCCCCHSLDIITKVTLSCHKQVIASCSPSGNSPGPGLPDFPSNDLGNNYRQACDAVLGQSGFSPCSNLAGFDWWHLNPGVGLCSCSCAKETAVGCDLTCVTCSNLWCESELKCCEDSLGNPVCDDCNYQLTAIPGRGCCGDPTIVSIMLCVDANAAMDGADISTIRSSIDSIITSLQNLDVQVEIGLIAFGWSGAVDNIPSIIFPMSSDISGFTSAINGLIMQGSGENFDTAAIFVAAVHTTSEWSNSASNHIILCTNTLGDRGSFPPIHQPTDTELRELLSEKNIVLHVIETVSDSRREDISTSTDGQLLFGDSLPNFSHIVDNFNVSSFPSDCNCLAGRSFPIIALHPGCGSCDDFDADCLNALPEICRKIPIKKCREGETNCDCDLTSVVSLQACGTVLSISPRTVNMVCCSSLAMGCECESFTDTPCCGPGTEPGCVTICDPISNKRLFSTVRAAQDAAWTSCWEQATFADDSTPNCTHSCCPDGQEPGDANYPCDRLDSSNPVHQQLIDDNNCCSCSTGYTEGVLDPLKTDNTADCCQCCMRFDDGIGGFTLMYCRREISGNIDEAVEVAFDTCNIIEEQPPAWNPPNVLLPKDERIEDIDDCTSSRHTDSVILNNGISLVAYENIKDTSVIHIKQFKTSIDNKLLANREFNLGRLEHKSKWTSTAKLYYFEELPAHLINPVADPDDPVIGADGIIFRNGPLAQQVFGLSTPALKSDNIGDYIEFIVSTDTVLTNSFPSSDDVYNVKFMLYDNDDTGLIGDAIDITGDAKDFIINNRITVDNDLLLPPHIYNGIQVPVAYPSIDVARNYSDSNENAHMVYLTYQAFEDGKWNIYLRQLRISEYSKQKQIDQELTNLVLLDELQISEVMYRIVCVSDECVLFETEFIIKRYVIMEVLLEDGREVFNNGIESGFWDSLCPGNPASDFPKNKVFIQFIHSARTDRCPDQLEFDDIFYKWHVGQEFQAPAVILTSDVLFNIISISNDTSIDVSTFNPPLEIGNVFIFTSSIESLWFDEDISQWATFSTSASELLEKYKGFDISEPILLTP